MQSFPQFIKPCPERPLAEAVLAIATLPAAACVSSVSAKCQYPVDERFQPAHFALVAVALAATAYSFSGRVRGRNHRNWSWNLRERPRVVALKNHDHGEDCESHSHSHSHQAAGSHSHSHEGHSHESHSHEGHIHAERHAEHSHSHSHESHSHDHESHGHSHGGCCAGGLYGHGHSHGEVPEWLPGKRGFRWLSDLSKTKSSIIGVTSIFLFSLLPFSYGGVIGAPLRSLRFIGPFLVYLVYGIPALAGALQHAAQLDIHFLMTLAAFASVAIGHSSEGAMLLLLFALSEVLEEKLSMKARASLDALGSLCPETVRRLPQSARSLADAEDGKKVKVLELREGDRIFVRAGEVIPVDGRILDGLSQLGLSHLTGEPLPQAVSPGDRVTSGAVTIDGALLIEVQRRAEESTLQRLAKLTTDAKVTRPKLVTLVDAVADRWSFAVVLSTLLIAAAPPLLWRAPIGPSLYRSLVWLITASPCALILATPLVYVSGLSVAAANGVLLKGGRTLDALAVANGVAFDKTGTLTTGSPVLQSVEEIGSSAHSAKELDPLPFAASLGQLSVHPVSRAMVAALPIDQPTYQVKDFQMVAGAGVTGNLIKDDRVQTAVTAVMGRPDFVSRFEGLDEALAKSLQVRAEEVKSGGSVMLALGLLNEGEASRAWLFHLEDCVKASAPQVVDEVAKRGSVYLLTGDREANAVHTVEKVGASKFQEIHADLRPEEKLAKVQEYDDLLRHRASEGSLWRRLLRSLGVSMGGLVMVGDSINDAPALAAATAGISLEAQADGALQSNAVDGSDVLVLRRAGDPQGDTELRRVAWIISLAKKARVIVIQNICLALGSIIGASSLTLITGMPLWLGVILHEGTTMLVGLNSLRLFSSSLRSSRLSGKVH